MSVQKNIGQIWKRKDQNGTEYLSIKIEVNGVKKEFIALKNDKKSNNQPDFSIIENTSQ